MRATITLSPHHKNAEAGRQASKQAGRQAVNRCVYVDACVQWGCVRTGKSVVRAAGGLFVSSVSWNMASLIGGTTRAESNSGSRNEVRAVRGSLLAVC